LLKLEATRVKKYEKIIFKKADLVYSSPSDIQLYKSHNLSISNHQITYHLGNDDLLELADIEFEETELALTFMGTLSWEPNIDGLLWFMEEIWPIIKKTKPDTLLYVLGKKG